MSEHLYSKEIGRQTVWVTVSQPAVFNPLTNQYEEKGFLAAFKIGDEPKIIDGEYVKESGKPKFFPSDEAARQAAFGEAEQKISRSN